MPPSYCWVCQNCQQRNDADTDHCAACSFPASATGLELSAFKNGVVPSQSEKIIRPKPDTPKNLLLPLAKLFWWAGGLFIPFTIFLMVQFGTRGTGGPGGWGSDFFILLLGIAAISPSLIVVGVLALLLGDNLKKGRHLLAGLFGLLLSGGLVLLAGEIYLLLQFIFES